MNLISHTTVKHKTGIQGASSDGVWLCSSWVHLFTKKFPSDVPFRTETKWLGTKWSLWHGRDCQQPKEEANSKLKFINLSICQSFEKKRKKIKGRNTLDRDKQNYHSFSASQQTTYWINSLHSLRTVCAFDKQKYDSD